MSTTRSVNHDEFSLLKRPSIIQEKVKETMEMDKQGELAHNNPAGHTIVKNPSNTVFRKSIGGASRKKRMPSRKKRMPSRKKRMPSRRNRK